MQRASATEGDQRVVARVIALLDRHEAQRADHVFVDDVVDAFRGVLHGQLQRIGDLLDGRVRQITTQHHVAAELLHLGQITQHDVGIGHRRLRAAAVVRRRARIGARRLRTDAQRLGQLRHVGDRAAAGTDRADVDRRGTHRDVTDRRLATQARFAILDQRDVRGGAADVHREEVREACLNSYPQRARDATGRAGHQQVHRILFGRRRRGETAVRSQDRQLHVLGGFVELGAQVLDVALDARTYVGIRDRGDGALVFLHLRHDFRRQRHRHARQLFVRDLADALLVAVVGERVDQRDGQRFDVLRLQAAQALAQRRLVQAANHFALGADALVGFDGQRERRHRQRLVVDHPAAEAARHERARDLQHLLVALGGHEAATRARTGQHRIGGDGGAMHHVIDFLRIDARIRADALDAVQHPDRLIGRRGGNLGRPGLAGLLIDQQQVRERAADIYTQSI